MNPLYFHYIGYNTTKMSLSGSLGDARKQLRGFQEKEVYLSRRIQTQLNTLSELAFKLGELRKSGGDHEQFWTTQKALTELRENMAATREELATVLMFIEHSTVTVAEISGQLSASDDHFSFQFLPPVDQMIEQEKVSRQKQEDEDF